MISLRALCGMMVSAALFTPAAAVAQDATLTVRISVASTSRGTFNNGGLSATRVTVFARSGFQARLNGPTGITGPSTGTAAAGSTFNVDVPRLYSPTAAGAANPYTIELSWLDTPATEITRSFGPVTLARGANTVGPYTIENAAPPAPSSISCYPNPPRTESDLYVFWSGPSPRPGDFDRFELHRSTTARFTPSASTLVSPLPWGISNRVATGHTPDTDYYFCIRILDAYGAFSDTCTTTPCRTTNAPRDAGLDVLDATADVPGDTLVDQPDAASDRGSDVFDAPHDSTDAAFDVPRDVAADIARDATVDTRDDGSTDVTIDRAGDVARDVPLDLGGMAGFVTNAPTSAPANTPYTYAPRAESASGAPATMYSATGLPPGATIDPRTGELSWLPGFDDVGRMHTITVIATLPGGMTVRQTFTVTVTCPDNDRDGRGDARCPMGVGNDCDDARADTFPGAPERCNGIDDDCNGRIDDGDPAALCGPSQSCDPVTQSCRPSCMSAAECTAAPRVCTTNRVCALCTSGTAGDATACAADPNGRACLVDSLGGILCGCNTDTDCGARNSGRTCDTTRHACVPGCGTSGARNGCPTGQRCVMTGSVGTCTRDCTDDDVCEALGTGRPFCSLTGTPRTCVGCRNNSDCATNADGRRYCDGTLGRCVACVPGRASQCVAAGAGNACLAGGVCGCNSDDDCGTRTSGRICDTFAGVCRGGCRPPGSVGNECPTNARCVMTATGVGRCEFSRVDGGDQRDASEVGDDTGTTVDVADAVSTDATQPTPDVVADDAASVVDVAVAQDLGDDATSDVPPDGPRPPGATNEGSCGCRAQAPTAPRASWVLALALTVLARRRRDGRAHA